MALWLSVEVHGSSLRKKERKTQRERARERKRFNEDSPRAPTLLPTVNLLNLQVNTAQSSLCQSPLVRLRWNYSHKLEQHKHIQDLYESFLFFVFA